MPIPAEQIALVRRFNRLYTQRIGVLHEGLLDSPYTLTEVRVLYEIAHRDGVGASELVADLGLDPGYLSRILKRFEQEKLVTRRADRADARRRSLHLTAAGRRTFAPLDARSQQQVGALLETLAAPRRERLLGAMRTIEDVLAEAPREAQIVLRTHRPGDIGWVVQRHGELYLREYGYDERFEAIVAGVAAEFLRRFDRARERAWIAERDGQRLGSVFLVARSRTVARLRLLLVEPEARGLGLGRRLVDACIDFAREASYRRIVLWTQSELDAARYIYTATGFRKTGESGHESFARSGVVAETWELKL